MIISLSILGIHNIASGEVQTINISDNPGESDRPQIFAYNDILHMLWTDKFEGNYEIYYSDIDGEFSKLSQPINLSNNNGSSAFPRLFVANDSVYATWYDYSPGQSDVFFAKSTDGTSFSSQNLSNDLKASYNPWIDGVGNHVYVVWNDGGKSEEVDVLGEKRVMDVLFGDMEIYFAHSDDNGKTFDIKNISNTEGNHKAESIKRDATDARMRVQDDKVFVVWTQDLVLGSEIYFSKSENYGLNFTTPLNISKSKQDAYHAGIALQDSNVYTIWKQAFQNKTGLYFSKSSDYGSTFSAPINLSTGKENSEITRDTQIVSFQNNVFVVFSAEVNKNREAYIAISRDRGQTFEEPINLSNNPGRSLSPQIYHDGNNLSIIWADNSPGNYDILLRQSIDGGHSFGPITNISSDSSNSLLSVLGPQIASLDDHVFTIWENKSKTDDLFLSMIPKDKSEYSFNGINQKINAKIQVNENDLAVPVEIHFEDNKMGNVGSDVEFKMTVIDQNGTVILASSQLASAGKFSDVLTLPKKGEYHVFIDSTNSNNANTTGNQNPDIIVNVVPEFPSGLAVFGVISIIFVILGKNYSKFKYLN